MSSGLSDSELNQIINRALMKVYVLDHNYEINEEINIFAKKYEERAKINPQRDFFEERIISIAELKAAQVFLDDLDAYRVATDIYNDDNIISESLCRRLMYSLDKYQNIISDENKSIYSSIRKNIWRNLPENREAVLLEDYINEADKIYVIKPKKNISVTEMEICAHLAYNFLKKVMKHDTIKNIKPCPKKLELYQKSLKLVDCLPQKSIVEHLSSS